jgi:hypothetical protein
VPPPPVPARPRPPAVVMAAGLVTTTVRGTDFVLPARYRVGKCIGTGAYGVVAAGVDAATGSRVAIKKVPAWTGDVIDGKRVLRETKMLRSMRHEVSVGGGGGGGGGSEGGWPGG